jgi:hypothetical protein
MSQLPSVGEEIPCSSYAVNVPFQVNVLGLVTLDFKGGWKVRVEAIHDRGYGAVKQKFIGLEWSADSPVLGKVTISQADVGTTPLGLLELVTPQPPLFRDTVYVDVTVTIEKPPGGGPPMVLANTRPMTLINNNLTAYPPQGSLYQLQQPVDLAPVDAPGQVVAQILQFPLTVSHNP